MPAVLPVAVSWRLRFPHHLAHYLGRRSLLGFRCPLPALPSRRLRGRRPVVISSSFRSASRPASRLASRLSARSLLCDVIAALPDRSPCRSACGHRSPRPSCRTTGSGTGSLSRHRLPALSPLLAWRVSRLRAFPRCGLLCLLGCRRLCRYCDGEIIYMICSVDII